ncbi:hypothetical protein AWENTII_007994 [Aspergillus wentii]
MALAYLCSQLEKSQLVNGLSVTAFVVDHKAREESSREANTVAGWLSDIGVKAQILELEWPQTTTTPSKVTAFETHARRLRFQAIGRACRDNSIETLLMGHHQDDNVETTLWRLSSGARGAGLAGIPRVARIPECHGLYGVSESGSSVKLPGRKTSLQINNKGEVQVQDTSSSSSIRPETTVSTGGISICRPLLSFPKANLLATCHENQIPFVSDPTNFDPTLTPRNAIRSLLSSNKLPLALQGPSILSLIKSSQNLLKNSDDLSNRLLETCKLLNLNLNTGSMVIQFPPSPTTAQLSSLSSSSTTEKTAEIQALTLRRITELISPYPDNHFSLRSFEPFTHRIFSTALYTMNMNRQSFTVGGVMFQPLRWKPLPTSSDTIYNNANVNANVNTWLLFRQPFMRHRAPVLRVEVPVPSSSLSSSFSHVSSPVYTPWTLWDDRYWFRFTVVPEDGDMPTQDHDGRQSISLVLRPQQQSDLTKLRRSFDYMPGKPAADNRALTELTNMLSREAPGQARFTVPVLTMENLSKSEENLLAIPTIGFRFPESGTQELLQASGWKVQWEWMYKKIDNEPLRLMGWLEDNS